MVRKIILLCFATSFLLSNVIPFSKKGFDFSDGDQLTRGRYLIVLSNPDLYSTVLGYFVGLKKTQGFNVDVISIGDNNDVDEGIDEVIDVSTSSDLKEYLEGYYSLNPLLEYVLLIGDVNQNSDNYNIPTFTIPSYNEAELDQTDYPYTYFDSEDILSPKFFIGRWSIGSSSDLLNIINRNLHYAALTPGYIDDPAYLNNALVVAGNYSGEGTSPSNWPVTPVWTSKWLQEELFHFGYEEVDSAFFHKYNYSFGTDPSQIEEAWNSGVGVINYRGWGDARGWHKPQFRLDEIESLLNPTLSLPVVFSFVCNTGDFGNEQNVFCFGEKLITAGTINAPKGAVAMIGPSDLDTDTRFNNVMCGALWDEMLEDRIYELGPALHMGKQSVAEEFEGLYISGTNIGEFYHHVYGVIGDPSLSVWLKEPGTMFIDIEEGDTLSNSFLNIIVQDSETGSYLQDVIGVVMINGEILGKGISNENGNLDLNFTTDLENVEIDLFLNKGQYYQLHIDLNYTNDNGGDFNLADYNIPDEFNYGYTFEIIDYNWKEISETGVNLNLVDDDTTPAIRGYQCGDSEYLYDLLLDCEDNCQDDNDCIGVKYEDDDFEFIYYGEEFNLNDIEVCSNGWASVSACLDGNIEDGEECDPISYFYNSSITFPIGPYGLLAPFYDDLDDNGGTEELNVYADIIDGGTKFVIQWDKIANGHVDEYCDPDSDIDPEECKKETFQLILFRGDLKGDINQDFILDILDIISIVNITLGNNSPTEVEALLADLNGDGSIDVLDIIILVNQIIDSSAVPSYSHNDEVDIIFQYKEIYNVDDHGATIGIESKSKNEGVQYLFNTSYHENAIEVEQLQESSSIRFYRPE